MIAILRPKNVNEAAILRIQKNGITIEEPIAAADALILSMALGDLSEEWFHAFRRDSDAEILRTNEQKRELFTWFISEDVKWAGANPDYKMWLHSSIMSHKPDMDLKEVPADSALGRLMQSLPEDHVVFTHFRLIADNS